MKKLIMSALAALAALIAVPALADPTPPAQVKMIVVQVGHLGEGNTAPIIKGDRKVTVTLKGCETTWTDNQSFYMLGAANAPVILIRKDIFDYAWEKSGQDWDTSFKAIVAANLACIVADAK